MEFEVTGRKKNASKMNVLRIGMWKSWNKLKEQEVFSLEKMKGKHSGNLQIFETLSWVRKKRHVPSQYSQTACGKGIIFFF